MPRYYVTELAGFSSSSGGGVKGPAISFSLLDRAQNHLEVYRLYAGTGKARVAIRRTQIERECERLNNLDPVPFDCAKGEETVQSPP